MAISTYKVFLMKQELEEWSKLLDITSFPDLGGEPEMIETTTLSDPMQTYIPGIQSSEGLTFEANYDKTVYQTLTALHDEAKDYAVWFGGTDGVAGAAATPTGDQGKFEFKGVLSVHLTGGGVNEAVKMSVTITPSSPITPKFA